MHNVRHAISHESAPAIGCSRQASVWHLSRYKAQKCSIKQSYLSPLQRIYVPPPQRMHAVHPGDTHVYLISPPICTPPPRSHSACQWHHASLGPSWSKSHLLIQHRQSSSLKSTSSRAAGKVAQTLKTQQAWKLPKQVAYKLAHKLGQVAQQAVAPVA